MLNTKQIEKLVKCSEVVTFNMTENSEADEVICYLGKSIQRAWTDGYKWGIGTMILVIGAAAVGHFKPIKKIKTNLKSKKENENQ